MKHKYIVLPALFLLMACDGTKDANPKNENNTKQETVVNTAKNDSLEMDAITGATALANDAILNGVIILPPQYHATVTLPIHGIVKNTSMLSGKYVSKGDLIATLDNPDFITLQQTYLETYAQCEFLLAEYQRQETLMKDAAASEKKFQQSKADYLSMKSRNEASAAQLTMLGVNPSILLTKGILPLLEVKAPINGYVSNLQINIGKYISAGEPLCEIVDKNNSMIKLTAYEKDVNRIKIGDNIDFRVNGMGVDVFRGEIISIGQQVDNINRSLEVYAKIIENNTLFRPGMYVNAQVAKK